MKSILTTFVLLCITTFSFSQDVKYGVKGGMTVSNLDYEDVPITNNDHRNGFVFGAFVEFGLSENLFVVTELQFSGEGADKEGFRNDYLNLPVILKYNVFGSVSVGVGPQVGLKVNKKDDNFKNFVFAAVGYFEYSITDEFAIDARYNYGISNVFDDSVTPEAKNGVIQFGINYKL